MEQAMTLFEASVRLQPDDYMHSQAVVTCQHLKRYEDALRHAQVALKINPLPEYHLDVGSALVAERRESKCGGRLAVGARWRNERDTLLLAGNLVGARLRAMTAAAGL